jgi:D-amino-acid dehydrogenase
MRVLVLGAGVIGTTAAWYLAARGHEVTVVDRREGAGMETSFANGGQISAGHPEPWANPQAPAQIRKWWGQEDSPLLFRLRMDLAQWIWCYKFLRECSAGRTRANIAQIAKLALYSREKLQALRADTGIEYDAVTRGILHYYPDRAAFDAAAAATAVVNEFGIGREVKSREEALVIEPALAQAGDRIVGATYVPNDESGDAHKFTRELARLAAGRGVRFLYGREIQAMGVAGNEVAGVVVKHGERPDETLTAHAYVVALGSYSPLLTGPVGLYLPVYPLKGYSITLEITDPAKAPSVSLTDEEAKLVMSRLGNRLRVAGTAELSGYSTDINPVRCDAIVRRAREIFPGAGDYAKATFWTGLRPSTPSNVPIVMRSRYPNLYVNTGHGTLGWTLACGSGALLADIISGRKPEISQ